MFTRVKWKQKNNNVNTQKEEENYGVVRKNKCFRDKSITYMQILSPSFLFLS